MRARTLTLLGLITAIVVGIPAAPVVGQSAADVRIRQTELEPDGTTRVVVSVTGDDVPAVLEASAFQVTEGGSTIEGVAVEPLLESTEAPPVSVSLVVDISGSTEGEPLDQAKAAATTFAGRLISQGVRVEVVAFSSEADVRAPLTDEPGAISSTIGELEASGETALYDAVILAAERLTDVEGQREIVVFSDGGDTASVGDLAAAVSASVAADTPVTSVALVTPELDQPVLDELAARTEGRTLSVADAGQLAGAFEQVAEQIASQYVLSYTSAVFEPAEFDLVVSIQGQGTAGTDTVTVINTREAQVVAPVVPTFRPAEPPQPLIAVFGSRTGLLVGGGAAFVALALLLGVGAAAARGNAAERSLHRSLNYYTTRSSSGRHTDLPIETRSISERVADIVDLVPKPARFDERLQERLERAAWPLRTGEFLAMQAAGGLGAGLGLWALTGNLVFGLLGAIVGGVAPRLILLNKIDRRSAAFLEQLPDTLQLLAGSLRAGYGLVQAMDTVVQETDDPTSTEFARVLTEARLGMPLEDALDGMADRMGSEDFRWVVMAINIQKQVGGNLANLLEVVAGTLREREQVRRQVKVLSAEGRLSAVILVALPFVFAGYLALVNGEYLGELLSNRIGLVMIVGAIAFMAVGVAWIRKIIAIEI